MHSEQTHRYDHQFNVWYPNRYTSYNDYKQKYLALAYTTQLLCKRLKLLIKYSKVHGDDAEYLKDELGLNIVALHTRADGETLKNIQCGLVNLNGIQHPVTLMDVIRDSELREIYFIPQSNFKIHMISICETISERLTNGIYDSKFITDIKDLIFKLNRIAILYGSDLSDISDLSTILDSIIKIVK